MRSYSMKVSLGFAIALSAACASTEGAILVSDNFSDGNYTSGPTWTTAGTGTWSVASQTLNLDDALPLNNDYDYSPPDNRVQTTFSEVAASGFMLTASIGFKDANSTATFDNNNLIFGVLNAAGTDGYFASVSGRVSLGAGWFGFNIHRDTVAGGAPNTGDVKGRLISHNSGLLRTYNADGTVASSVASTLTGNDNRYDLTFTRTGSSLTFTLQGTNLTSEVLTMTITDPNGEFSDIGQLVIGTGLPDAGYLIDNVVLDYTPIPEPASLSLLGLGALALARRSRRH